MSVTVADLLGSGAIPQLRERITRHARRDLLDEAAAVIAFARAKELLDGINARGDEARNAARVGVYRSALEKMVAERPETKTWRLLLDNLETK